MPAPVPTKKIFNDPVYGFITIPLGAVFRIVEHPYFQRLRRIKQLGLTNYVYPGANHTRFHHALGAFHLMSEAIEVLRSKGVAISPEEAEAAQIAILLHDVGHGPFSHALERRLANIHHEELSVLFMQELNEQTNSNLDLAIRIFTDTYHKRFLHQLVSSQLDVDRLDYLTRDSFFTGVYEGVIGYDRIIKMLAVVDDTIVVEEKGIYSIEKFLIARKLMYWQAYLHKTALCAEQMLVRIIERLRQQIRAGKDLPVYGPLRYFLEQDLQTEDFLARRCELLALFSRLDDDDIMFTLKSLAYCDDKVLSYFAQSIINRRLFKVEISNEPFADDYIEDIRQRIEARLKVSDATAAFFIIRGSESNTLYKKDREDIKILFKDGRVKNIWEFSDIQLQLGEVTKHFLCYPKEILMPMG